MDPEYEVNKKSLQIFCVFCFPYVTPDLYLIASKSKCMSSLRILTNLIYSSRNLTAKLISSHSLQLKLSSGLIVF